MKHSFHAALLRAALIIAALTVALPAHAQCPTQTTPALTSGGNVFGRIAAQWNAYLGAKIDQEGGCSDNQILNNPTINGTGSLFGSEPPNEIFAGPTTGLPSQPVFRALTGADLPYPGASSLGGVQSLAQTSHEWLTGLGTNGIFTTAEPGFGDLTGNPTSSQITTGLGTTAANTFLAGPTSGSAATGAYRAMVTADLPSGIPNSLLLNPGLTLGSTALTLGGTVTSIAGLTGLGLVDMASGGAANGAVDWGFTDSGSFSGAYQPIYITFTDGINGGSNFVDALTLSHTFGGSSVEGGRQSLAIYGELTSPTSASNPNRNYVAGLFSETAESGDGGTAPSIAGGLGAIFGVNPSGFLAAGGTNFLEVTGGEVNYGIATGGSAALKFGLSIVDSVGDDVRGSVADAVLGLGAQSSALPNGGAAFGILFYGYSGANPVGTDGTLIGVEAASGGTIVTNGVNFSAYTITGCAFKSTDFCTSGSGAITSSSIAFSGAQAASPYSLSEDGAGWLVEQGGADGIRFINNAENANNFLVSDAGAVTIRTSLTFSALPTGTAASYACFTAAGALVSSSVACP